MNKLYYNIQVRRKDGRLYKDEDGHVVGAFKDETIDLPLASIKKHCLILYMRYKAIAKEGTSVDIEVSVYNHISETYMCMHSFYDCDKIGGGINFVSH